MSLPADSNVAVALGMKFLNEFGQFDTRGIEALEFWIPPRSSPRVVIAGRARHVSAGYRMAARSLLAYPQPSSGRSARFRRR